MGSLSEVRRGVILDAMIAVVCERGYAHTTVTEVCGRARVSRGSFYQEFDGLQDCFLEVIDAGRRRAEVLIVEAFEYALSWRDGLRMALASLLAEMDLAPALARVWLIETLAAGGWALERRDRHVAALTGTIVGRWPMPAGSPSVLLAAPGVMESMLGLIRGHLVSNSEEPAIALLGELMGVIVNVYLDASAAAAEIECCEALTRRMLAARDARCGDLAGDRPGEPVSIPVVLRDPRAHRSRGCLLYLLENPAGSNRDVGRAVGVARDDQVSTMLTRLEGMGLLIKRQGKPGSANSWMLSSEGKRVARALKEVQNGGGRAPSGVSHRH